MKKKLRKIANIKFENIALIVAAILFGMVLDTTIKFELYDWKGIAMCIISLLHIPLSYFGFKTGREILKEVWL